MTVLLNAEAQEGQMPCVLDFILVGYEHKPTSQATACQKFAVVPLTPYSHSQK